MKYNNIAAIVALSSCTAAYSVSFYDGTMCNGAFLHSMDFTDYSCQDVPTYITGDEASAYVSETGDDDGLIVEFYSESGCGGNPIAQVGGSGCASTFENGFVRSVRQNAIPAKRDSTFNQSFVFTSPHETYSKARVAAGLEAVELPEADEGYKWLDIAPGHWVKVESTMTRSELFKKHGYSSAPHDVNLNFNKTAHKCSNTTKPSECYDDFVQSDRTFTGTSKSSVSINNNVLERDLVSTCRVLYYCSLPFFAVNDATQIYQSDISPIINSAPVQALWGIANNGYLIGYATHYYFVKTTNQVPASVCDTAKTDKQEIIDGLTQQLVAVQAKADAYYSALGQCLSTNQPLAGVTTGSLTMTGWTTITTRSRCTEEACS